MIIGSSDGYDIRHSTSYYMFSLEEDMGTRSLARRIISLPPDEQFDPTRELSLLVDANVGDFMLRATTTSYAQLKSSEQPVNVLLGKYNTDFLRGSQKDSEGTSAFLNIRNLVGNVPTQPKLTITDAVIDTMATIPISWDLTLSLAGIRERVKRLK